MPVKLIKQEVGPWPMNAYILICEETQKSAIIDPGADAEKLAELAKATKIEKILITHGHSDHVGALEEIKAISKAPVFIHPLDAEKFKLTADNTLNNGEKISVGNVMLTVIHTPGHTAGQVCFDLGDGRIIVGDTLFVNGPGRTQTPKDFSTTMATMQNIVFNWPDETEFFPGHGPSGTIGKERPAFNTFVQNGWSKKLKGDVTWKKN